MKKQSGNIYQDHLARESARAIEARFGVDFSGTDIERSALPARWGMWGLAVGRDVLIANDAPSVTTREGLWLLAHELAHTLQHRSIAPSTGRAVLLESPDLEAAADRFADAVVATLCDGAAPDMSVVPSAPGPITPSGGLHLQAAFRHKFEFIPAPDVPPQWAFLVAKISGIFSLYAQQKKAQSDMDYQTMQNALNQPHAGAHPILHAYEKDHLQHGKDWHELVRTLLSRCAGQIRFSDDPSSVNLMRDDGISILAAHSTGQGQSTLVNLGSVTFGRHRFRHVNPQPVAALSYVYERRAHPGKHYIYAPATDTFVRRFVIRGLNQSDALNLDRGRDLEAPHTGDAQLREIYASGQLSRHVLEIGEPLSMAQQLLSHTRGWQKRFISTGVSNRPALSTRGTPFASVFGAATIDLAYVDPRTIFPLDNHLAAERMFGGAVTALEVVNSPEAQPAVQSVQNEEFLAMRDVLRTRELVILGTVPNTAVHAQLGPSVVLGIAGTHGPKRMSVVHPATATFSTMAAANSERLSYPWDGPVGSPRRWWWFAAYPNRGAANAARLTIDPLLEASYIFGTYMPVQPPGTN